MAETAPTQQSLFRDIAENGRMARQVASGCSRRSRAEPAMSHFNRMIGDGLRSHPDERRATEVEVAVHVLDPMLDLGCPHSIRVA